MHQDFFINKQSGTYSETLEAFGVANLVNEILLRLGTKFQKVIIKDIGPYYLVNINKVITPEVINKLTFFQVVKFIKNDIKQNIPDEINDYYDYPTQKDELDRYKKEFEKIESDKKLTKEQKKAARKALNGKKLSEYGQKLDPEYDVYSQIIRNPYRSFTNLYENFYQHRPKFHLLIKEILDFYTQKNSSQRDFKLVDEKPTSQQLYNPNQGKGLNRDKANKADLASMKNLNGNWISETMKISGALSIMTCQYIKVGSKYDLKIFVPEFHDIQLSVVKNLISDFKKHLKGTTPIKLDVLNILDLTIKFIQKTPEYRKGKIRNTIKGFHTVYQKSLSQHTTTVANISFISTPDFIAYQTKEQGREWINILEQQRSIILGIEEQGDAIQALQAYRNFLGSLEHSALNSFTKFSYWYAKYLMQSLDKEKYYVKPFQTETLNKFYSNMEPKLSEIIKNEGFKAVASAIRKSTVTLQYTPKEQREFSIRYGLAQQLQNKSKSKEDLATFFGEFIATYNAETAKHKEKTGKALRANVKDSELVKFYELLDQNPSRLVGALLASYGFALTTKDKIEKAELDNIENVQS